MYKQIKQNLNQLRIGEEEAFLVNCGQTTHDGISSSRSKGRIELTIKKHFFGKLASM